MVCGFVVVITPIVDIDDVVTMLVTVLVLFVTSVVVDELPLSLLI